MSKNFPAPLKCVDCVEQSVKAKTIEEGLAFELRHVLGPDGHAREQGAAPCLLRRTGRQQDPRRARDTPVRAIHKVGVIGAGTMGGGITMNFLNAGIPVTMLEMKQEALDRGVATIRKNYEAQVKKGKLKQDKYEQRMALLSTTLSYDDLKDADLVIEAVFEEWRSSRRCSRRWTG
jgi:3-hydroxyacyl-CoA dehydrogenase